MKQQLQYIFKGLRWKNIAIGALILLPVIIILAQLMHPADRTLPGASIDGVELGKLSHEEAAKRLTAAYGESTIDMYFGEAEQPYRSPQLRDLGASVNGDAVAERLTYPWWLRLVPTSLWWGHLVTGDEPVKANVAPEKVAEYVKAELGEECRVEPKNASIRLENEELQVVPAEGGGECQAEEVIAAVEKSPLSVVEKNAVRLPVQEIAPAVSSADAKALKDTINSKLEGGVVLTFEDESAKLDAAEVRSWLVFEVEKDKLRAQIDSKKSKKTLDEKAGGIVAVKPGVLTITTRDFTELSRRGGPDGRALNVENTGKNIAAFLMGEAEAATAATKKIPAERKYNRSYTSTSLGLSALSRHFAEDNPGTYGISLVELSGMRRQAGYNEDRKFTTASTYKTYVAYSTLKRIDSKDFKWSDKVTDDRDLSKCFDDMIVLSDNPCAEALVKKIGYNALHADVQALGLTRTSFIDAESFKTTAGDLTSFMQRLETKMLPISSDSRSRFIAALKRNVHRNGIPAGTSGTVADKVGFLEGFLHDTAIVYDSNGTYVLTILTDGSSWGNIAKLTQEIEKLRAR